MKWENATSYRSGQVDRTPNAWRARAGDLLISVVSAHRYYPGQWVMHCSPWFDTYDLRMPANEFTSVQAQHTAVDKVRSKLNETLRALGEIAE